MFAELAAEGAMAPARRAIYIAGVNEYRHESGFAFLTATETLPWLQDTTTYFAWGTWRVNELRPDFPGVKYRDVIVLDADNRAIAVYNLTEHSLDAPANYEALKSILRTAATR